MKILTTERSPADNTGLAKVAVQCSSDTFVVKIATFDNPENVVGNRRRIPRQTNSQSNTLQL